MFELRFSVSEIEAWANRYKVDAPEVEIIETIVPRARKAGFLTRPDFLEICAWKTPRTKKLCQRNSADYIENVTRIAFSTPYEQLRIGVLNLLVGVSWPTASVFLHLAHTDPYPLLDYRALWSLSVDKPPTYNFPFWEKYAIYCRQLAHENNLPMRMLDRALWQYSSEHQPPNQS